MRLIGTPPRRSTYDTGTFYWTSDEDASYECAIDLAESGTPCGSGVRQSWISSKLKDGHHSFYLFATDSNGNQGNPVEYKWEIGKFIFDILSLNPSCLKICNIKGLFICAAGLARLTGLT